MESQQDGRKVFMCLDVNTYQFQASTAGNTKGVIILTIVTILYWAFNLNMLPVYMTLMDTISKTKPFIFILPIYLLIAQKIIRVFIIKEKQLLEQFLSESKNNILTLGDFYNVKSAGYIKSECNNKTYHKVSYMDGTEDTFIKFNRGSLTSEYANTKDIQVKVVTNFLTSLMKQKIIPRIIISDERVERSSTFKFFQEKLIEGNFHPDFVDICNSTLLYHEFTAENYSRITSTYYLVPARTGKQKIFLDNFIKTLENRIKYSPFRSAILMDKPQILNMFKDLNALNSINELDLQTAESARRVKLGATELISVKDIITGEVVYSNEPPELLKINVAGIELQVLPKTGGGIDYMTSEEREIEKELGPLPSIDDFEDEFSTEPEVHVNSEQIQDEIEELPYVEQDVSLDTLLRKTNPLMNSSINLESYTVKSGVLDFKSATVGKTDIEKTVILINNIRNKDCETIIL